MVSALPKMRPTDQSWSPAGFGLLAVRAAHAADARPQIQGDADGQPEFAGGRALMRCCGYGFCHRARRSSFSGLRWRSINQRSTVGADEITARLRGRDCRPPPPARARTTPSRAWRNSRTAEPFAPRSSRIVKESKTPEAPRGRGALALLPKGNRRGRGRSRRDPRPAEAEERATASAEAAEAARNLGALAYLERHREAIEAYGPRPGSTPTTPGRGSSLAACISEQATWPPPSRHSRGLAKRPSAPAMSGT